jgi:biotin carboxylase
VGAAAKRLGFPVVVSAVDSQTRYGRAADADALDAAAARALAESRGELCLVEQASTDPHVVVAGFVAEGRLFPLLVADEAGDTESSDEVSELVWPSQADRSTRAATIATATQAVSAMGITSGPVWLRLALAKGTPLVERVAPRLGANHEAELCRAALGIDLNVLTVRAELGEQVAVRELAGRARVRAACLRFLFAEPGELRAVMGLAEAFAAPAVTGIRIYRRPGHVFHEPDGGASRAGAVLAVGGDHVEALAASAKAAGLIRFETADATALV